MNKADSIIVLPEPVEYRLGAVRGTVIDDNELEIIERLVDYAPNSFLQVGPFVVYGHDDAHLGG